MASHVGARSLVDALGSITQRLPLRRRWAMVSMRDPTLGYGFPTSSMWAQGGSGPRQRRPPQLPRPAESLAEGWPADLADPGFVRALAGSLPDRPRPAQQ